MNVHGASHAAYEKTRHFPTLDGLRCISIVAVVWHHAWGADHVERGPLAHGHLGVQLFFAISGFLITTLLLRERTATGEISLAKFYARRTLRIFPLYYAVVALYVVVVLLLERHTEEGREFFHNLPYFLTYTTNWFVDFEGSRVIFFFSWSLATEEQFYLAWPWIVRGFRRWTGPVAVMSGLVLLTLGAGAAVRAGWIDDDWLWVRVVTSIAPAICLGCLAAFAVHHRSGFEVVARVLGHRASAPVALALVVLAVALEGVPRILVYVAMTALVVACCIRQDHGLAPVLGLRAMRHVGTVSYGMYLLHLLSINAVRRALPGSLLDEPLVVFPAGLVLTILAATISYRFYELPFLRLKDRFRPKGVDTERVKEIRAPAPPVP
jgi:peptidoglycan/LPS O-acetylase OafA/YrhL